MNEQQQQQYAEPKRLPSFFETVVVEPKTRVMPVSPGRPPKPLSKNEIARAEALAKKLQAAVRLGLDSLLKEYPKLIDIAVERAKGTKEQPGDTKLLMFLIALPLKMVTLDEFRGENLGNQLIKEALTGGQVNIQINNMDRVPEPIIEATWRDADEGTTGSDDGSESGEGAG